MTFRAEFVYDPNKSGWFYFMERKNENNMESQIILKTESIFIQEKDGKKLKELDLTTDRQFKRPKKDSKHG